MSNAPIPSEHQLYQNYSIEEDAQRSAYHYEQDPRFYYAFTGGEWNVYSCILWPEESTTPTEAQAAKLDLMAREMKLEPGKRILDVGCGWGGPLVYLCQKYGVTGVGITVSAKQRDEAEARAKKYGVDAQFQLTHWENFSDEKGFDAVYSDEVIVHFHYLEKFFAHTWNLLKFGGRSVHKELHYTHSKHTIYERTGEHVQSVFAFTGNYRLLGEELLMLNNAGFEMVNAIQIPMENYHRTVEYWLNNLFDNRDELIELVGEKVWRDFRKYFKIVRRTFSTNAMTLDVVVSQKIDPKRSENPEV
jgi:cyclopropane-fatty-acyl-phospholipid synthase